MVIGLDSVDMVYDRIAMRIRNKTLGDKTMNQSVFPMDIGASVSGIFQSALLLMIASMGESHCKNSSVIRDEVSSGIDFGHHFSRRRNRFWNLIFDM